MSQSAVTQLQRPPERGPGAARAEASSAIAELYREFGPSVYRRCLRLLRDPEAARDATQEVFIKLVRHQWKLQDRATVLPWMYRVATNHCLNQRRNGLRRNEEELSDLATTGTSPDAYAHRALAQLVLSRFDEATQAIAVGVLVDGMEHAEVAEALGVSRRTISRKLERFLERAREYVGEAEEIPPGDALRS